MKTRHLLAVPLCLSVTSAPSVAAAATVQQIISGFETTIRPLVGVGLGVAVAVFVWGVVLFIAQSGNDTARAQGRVRMLWGIIGLVLIVSVWAIVAILRTLVGVDGITDCAAPQINENGVANCFE